MRYTRQIILPLIGKKGQEKLQRSRVCIVGVGALGSTTAALLARAGIGHLTLIDRDILDISNLQRQTLYDEADVNLPKAVQAEKHLKAINSTMSLQALPIDLHAGDIDYLKNHDLIIDGTDNMETRMLVNDYALKYNIPWVYGSAIQDKGYVMNIIPKKTPCFNCIFSNTKAEETCETAGVLNTITNVIASLQVNEAFKILLQQDYEKDLLYINLTTNTLEKIKVKQRKDCKPCHNIFEYLSKKAQDKIIKFCGHDTFQIQGKERNINELAQQLAKLGPIKKFDFGLSFQDLIYFNDGRTLIKAKEEKEAKIKYTKFIGN